MKKVFRQAGVGIFAALLFVFGAVAASAQDPCDAEAMVAAGDKFRTAHADKSIPGRKSAIQAGKEYLEKFGSCEGAKELADWLKERLPRFEATVKEMEEEEAKAKLVGRFDAAMKAKNWDEVYASGKEVLAKYGEEFRAAEIVLGSIGYDEAFAGRHKYNDDTVRFAKQAIASLEAGKEFTTYGVTPFSYKNRADALGWLNLTVGYIYAVPRKNRAGALPYLYKATQADSDTKKNPIPYELIGFYYFDELNKLVEEIKVLERNQNDTDTIEVAKQKIEVIRAKVALANGTAERAMDAFARAYTLGQAAPYKASMKKNVEDAYRLRFAKTDGVDSWIANTVKQPLVNPTTPVTPIFDGDSTESASTVVEPAKTRAAAGARKAN
jgi:hypothetical protein